MSPYLMIVAATWGLAAGYLVLRLTDSLLGLLCCLHGLFERRWKILADKNATGLIRPRLLLKLALRLGAYALVCGVLLRLGDEFFQREFRLRQAGFPWVVFAIAAGAGLLSRLLTSCRRLRLVWRLSHEYDFAERRERTRSLKG